MYPIGWLAQFFGSYARRQPKEKHRSNKWLAGQSANLARLLGARLFDSRGSEPNHAGRHLSEHIPDAPSQQCRFQPLLAFFPVRHYLSQQFEELRIVVAMPGVA